MNEATGDVDSRGRGLLQRMAAGDRAALEMLYRACPGGLCRFPSHLRRRAGLIERIANDWFRGVWRTADNSHSGTRLFHARIDLRHALSALAGDAIVQLA